MSIDPQPEIQQQSESLKRQLVLSWILMLLLVVLLLLPALKIWFNFGVSGTPRPVTPRGALADYEQTTVDLFRETSSSVVYITTQARVADYSSRRIFEVESGTGSGFVWDSDGHIVTNYHVIKGASSHQVVFFDQSSFEAKFVGASPDHDLAVLRIQAPASLLRPVLIGESHNLEVGQSVFAIGNPFGLHQTLTTGVVSAKSRSIESPSGSLIEDVIQIDAAINPGNSGGPLLDSAGRLVGVNTAIYSPSGTSAGVGFSIPVDTVNRVVPQIIQNGKYEPPRLGIYINEEINRVIRYRTGVDGVMVLNVDESGPAAHAGLRPLRTTSRRITQQGDIIQGVDNHKITSVRDLQDVLQQYKAGDTVTITLFREDRQMQVDVQLE